MKYPLSFQGSALQLEDTENYAQGGWLLVNRARLIFVLFQLIHILCFSAFLGTGINTVVLVSSGVVCLCLYSWLLVSEFIRSGKHLSPFLFYLAAGVFRLGVGTLYAAALHDGGYGMLLKVGVYNVSAYLMEGHSLLMIGDLCFILGYFVFLSKPADQAGGIKTPNNFTGPADRQVYQLALMFLVFSIVVRVAENYVSFGGFGQLLGYISGYGPAAALYIMLTLTATRGRLLRSPSSLFVWSMVFANIVWSLFSYMKTDLFIALLAVVLVGMQGAIVKANSLTLRSLIKPALLLALVGYLFLFVVSAYSQLRRPDFWSSPHQLKPVSGTEVAVASHLGTALLSALPWTQENAEQHRFPQTGVWGLVSRMTCTTLPAWAYGRVRHFGTNPDSFITSLLTSITPRLFWPGKPQLSPGADFTALIGMARSGATATTATALTMQGAYYWWGGMFALIIGCFVTGAGFAVLWNLFSTDSVVNPISSLMALVLFYSGFHWFESAFLGAVDFYLYALIVFLPLRSFFRRYMDTGLRMQERNVLRRG